MTSAVIRVLIHMFTTRLVHFKQCPVEEQIRNLIAPRDINTRYFAQVASLDIV